MYSVADYLWMIADGTRVAAYAGAIRGAVHAGDRVLDVGTGFGFFSVVAAQAGAGRVDAVDTNPVVHLGPRVAQANHFESTGNWQPRSAAPPHAILRRRAHGR